MPSARGQIDSLTGLRGVAATWVMLMHFREITPTYIWKYPFLDTLIAHGAYGVDIFFVLSGFILSHVYRSSFSNGLSAERIRQFMLYRFARLYPVHLVTFAIMLTLLAAKLMTSGSGGIPERYDPVTIALTLLLMHAWIPGMQTPNMPAWSISAEWFAYILFPMLCFLVSYSKWVPLLFIVAGLCLADVQTVVQYPLTHVLSGFLVGMAAYGIMSRAHWINIGNYTGLVVASAVGYWAQKPAPSVEIGLLLFSLLIVALAQPRDLLGRFLSLGAIVYLGEISYSVYMVHWPARVIVRNALQMLHLLDKLPPPIVVCAFVFVTLIGAMASYHFVELPGRALLRRTRARVPGVTRVPAAAAEP